MSMDMSSWGFSKTLSPTPSAPAGRDFFDLVKSIGESKSKQEEDRIVAEEVAYLKKAFATSNANKRKAKELVIRSLYVEMLGQDATFSYLKIVELCASSNLVFKKAGYLAASLTLEPDHEFRLMLVNRMQQDMKSANQVEACIALSGVCKLVTEDMAPAVVSDVLKLLQSDMDMVRKKAVCAIHRLYQLDPSCLEDHYSKINVALCDKDPAVMAATLPLILELSKANVNKWKSLVPHLVSILKQIVDHRLPKDFDYHRIPAPWVQMSILRILAVLGRGDQSSSEGMYEVLIDVIKRADTGINVGYAIVYECVTTITTIYPNTILLDAAATSISRFIRSDSHNLKYIGIKGLAAIVKDHPRYAADHQMAVIDCLEDPDETLKRKTLSLLYRMTNGVNVEFVVDKLLGFLATAKDEHFREDLVEKVTLCAERYAPSNAWFVRTIIAVFESGGDKVKRNVANTLIQLIAEGSGEDSDDGEEDGDRGDGESDDELRAEAVEDFLRLIRKPRIPVMLAQTMSWVLGEYGYLCKSSSPEMIIEALCELANNSNDSQTLSMAVTATMKLVAQSGTCPGNATALIAKYSKSHSVDVQQRCVEFATLLTHSGTMADVLPVDASCEDLEVDVNMGFLDGFVRNALAAGAVPYSPPQNNTDGNHGAVGSAAAGKRPSLNFAAYDAPQTPTNLNLGIMGSASSAGGAGAGENGLQHSHPALTNPIPGSEGGNGQGGMSSMLSPPTHSLNAATVNNAVLSSQGGTGGGAGPWGRNMAPVNKPNMQVAPKQLEQEQAQSPSLSPGAIVGRIDDALTAEGNASGGVSPLEMPSAASAEPEKPKELTEKEKMAAALFGGFGGGSGAGGGKGKVGISSRRGRGATSAACADGGGGGDLLGVNSAATPAVPAAAVDFGGSTAMSSDPSDLFGGMTINAPATTGGASASDSSPAVGMPAPPPVPVANSNDTTDLLFSGMSVGNSVTQPPPVPAMPGADDDDMMRPLFIATPQFGEKWGTLAGESTRSRGTASIKSLGALRGAMEGSGFFAHVETIEATSEAIFAATVNASGGDVLCHVKLNVDSADITVKAGNNGESAAALEALSVAVSF
jgi:AP-4 complex subunit epsilon-1